MPRSLRFAASKGRRIACVALVVLSLPLGRAAGDPNPVSAPAWAIHCPGIVAATPTLIGDTLVVVNRTGLVSALRVPTGDTLWQATLEGPVGPGSVALMNGLIWVAHGESLVTAIRLRNGTPFCQLSTSGAEQYGFGIAIRGWQAIYGSMRDTLYVVDGRSGHIVARTHVGGRVLGRACVTPQLIVVTTVDSRESPGSEPEGRILALSRTDLHVVWRHTLPEDRGTPGGAAAGPVFQEGLIVAGSLSGHLYAFQPGTGRLAWSRDLTTPIIVSPVPTDQGLLVLDSATSLTMLDPRTGRTLWSYALPGTVLAGGVAIAGSRAVVSTAGAQLWMFNDLRRGCGRDIGYGMFPIWRAGRLLAVKLEQNEDRCLVVAERVEDPSQEGEPCKGSTSSH